MWCVVVVRLWPGWGGLPRCSMDAVEKVPAILIWNDEEALL